jgi:hypothetical protein
MAARTTHIARGATAIDDTHNGPRHVLGSALRAALVFVDTAFRVTVLPPENTKL